MTATITVTVTDNGHTVQHFTRTAPSNANDVRRISRQALGWLQAWADQLGDEQWQADTKRVAVPRCPVDYRPI